MAFVARLRTGRPAVFEGDDSRLDGEGVADALLVPSGRTGREVVLRNNNVVE